MTFSKALNLLALIAGALLALAGSYLCGNYFEIQLVQYVPIGQLLFAASLICIGAAVFTAALMQSAKWSMTA